MKKTYFSFCILLFLNITPTISQTQLGLKGGLIFLSVFKPNPNYDMGINDYTTPNPSYFLSFMLRQRKPSCFNMAGELQYTHRFFHVKSDESSAGGDNIESYDISSDYFRILLQPQFIFGSDIKFFISPGVYFGYMFHSSLTGSIEWIGSWPPEPIIYVNNSAKGYINTWEFGALLGIVIDVPVYKHLILVLEALSTISIPNIKPEWATTNIRFFEIGLSAGLAYTFPKKKHNDNNSK